MKKITFKQFQATRRECADLGTVIDDLSLDGVAGLLYMDNAFIERTEDGRYMLTLHNEGWVTGDGVSLEQLEAILYGWCLTECPDDMGASEADCQFACNLQNAMGMMNWACALLANVSESNASVCHMQDYCDANECALAAAEHMRDMRKRGDAPCATLADYEGDTDALIDEAAEIYDAARPFIRGA